MSKIGLTQRISVIEEYGERRDCLDQEWTILLENLGYTPIPLPTRIEQVGNYVDNLSLDAIILTSGNDLSDVKNPSNPAIERDEFEKDLLDYAIKNEIPALGVCRGIEFLNVYFEGKLTPVEDDVHVATTHKVEFSDEHLVDIKLPDQLTVNSYHDYGISSTDVGNKLNVLAKSPDNTVECLTHESLPIWGIMWHPERDSPSSKFDKKLIKYVLDGEKI